MVGSGKASHSGRITPRTPNLWLGPKGAFTESGTGQMVHERGVAAALSAKIE